VAVESGAWIVNVFPICEKFPCTREEFRGSWEDRFNYDYVMKMYEKLRLQGALASFYQELMLQILSDDTRLISDSDLKWYSRKALMANKGNFNFYITTDFATSEKQFSDFSFISVWAVNNKGFKYWVDGVCKRQTMDKNIDDLFKFCQQYSPQSVGIEVSGQQGGFVSWIEKEMLTRNIFFSLASESNEGRAGIRPSTSKLQRFNVAVPYFKMGEMFFPVEEKGGVALDELLDELSLTTVGGFKSKHDDALDTISMLPLMPIWLPSSSTEFTQGKSKIWGTAVETGSDFTASYFC
jgi:phage terminase large subunit-like protein